LLPPARAQPKRSALEESTAQRRVRAEEEDCERSGVGSAVAAA